MIAPIGSSGPEGTRKAAGAGEPAPAGAAGKARARKAADPAQDQVTLSPLAKDLGTVRAHLADAEPARAARVAQIKDMVARGEYRIDADALAARLRDAFSA